MKPLDLNIFTEQNNSFYNMGKKSKRKVANPTDDILKVADFAVKASVAVALTGAVIGTTASVLNR